MINNEQKIAKEMFEPAHIDLSKSERIAKPSLNFWQDSWLRVRKNKGAVVSFVVLVILVLMAFIGPLLTPYAYDTQNTKNANLPPRIQGLENVSWLPFDGTLTKRDGTVIHPYELRQVKEYYWFGTDGLGRDMFARIWKGTVRSVCERVSKVISSNLVSLVILTKRQGVNQSTSAFVMFFLYYRKFYKGKT